MNSPFPQHLFQVLAEEAIYGIVVFMQNGSCLFINRMAEQMLDTNQPQLNELTPETARPPFKSFHPDLLKHDGLYQDILVRGGANRGFLASIGIKNLEVDGLQTRLIMMQDVTLQKKMQREITAKQNEIKATFEELVKQNIQLKELDVAKNRFIALTTHELRTPLSAMVASSEILKLKLYDNPEQMQEFIDMIHEQGLHLQELVNDILDFAKIQAGKMDFFIEELSILEILQTVSHEFSNMADQNQVHLHFEKPESDVKCYFDSLRLRQIFSNVVNNAIKYNRPQGQVRIYLTEDAQSVKIYVEDTGKGIPADQFEKVFNEFETVGQVANHHKGTGLGMPISRKLAEGMGGQLLFTSQVGVGSVFWIELPKTKTLDPSLYQTRPTHSGDFAA